jgi:hypothetical protein
MEHFEVNKEIFGVKDLLARKNVNKGRESPASYLHNSLCLCLCVCFMSITIFPTKM